MTLDQATKSLRNRASHELTDDEAAECIAAVAAHLEQEHAAFLVWYEANAERLGLVALEAVR